MATIQTGLLGTGSVGVWTIDVEEINSESLTLYGLTIVNRDVGRLQTSFSSLEPFIGEDLQKNSNYTDGEECFCVETWSDRRFYLIVNEDEFLIRLVGRDPLTGPELTSLKFNVKDASDFFSAFREALEEAFE